MRIQRFFLGFLSSIWFWDRTTSALLLESQPNTLVTSRRSMDSCQATAAEEESNGQLNTLRMLVLHGKSSSGEDFVSRLGAYQAVLKEEFNTHLDLVAIDAPYPLEGGGFAWWSMPPGVRSFNAVEYEGFEASSELALETLTKQGPFDIIYGHSQGAILTASLLALHRFPAFPTKGFLLNGVSWPNPFAEQLTKLEYATGEATPRILIITGQRDKINSPETQEQVQQALENAGADVAQVTHPAGHNIPMQRDETLKNILEWMLT